MRWRQGISNLFSGYRADPIPGWLIWPAVGISLLAFVYGLRANLADFLLNIAAGVALLGPGLFITNRVVRNWRHRELRPIARNTPGDLAMVIRRLRTDLANGLVKLGVDAGAPVLADNSIQQGLGNVASLAGALGKNLEQMALTYSEDVLIPDVSAELTTGRAVARLGYDLDRLDAVLMLPEVRKHWTKIQEAAESWEAFRLSSSPGGEVLIAASAVAFAAQRIACRLASDLPRYLS